MLCPVKFPCGNYLVWIPGGWSRLCHLPFLHPLFFHRICKGLHMLKPCRMHQCSDDLAGICIPWYYALGRIYQFHYVSAWRRLFITRRSISSGLVFRLCSFSNTRASLSWANSRFMAATNPGCHYIFVSFQSISVGLVK